MKIDPNVPLPENISSQRAEQSSSATAPAPSEKETLAPKGALDQARLSVDLERVNQLQTELARLPEARQERVEALQRAMQEGSFQATNEQIADSILSELLGESLSNR